MTSLSDIQVGVLGCILLVILLFSSMPVAFAMAIVGILGFAIVRTPESAMSLVAADFFDTFSNSTLTVIPLFVFMGQIAFHAGISRRLYYTAYKWLGALPGGLAMATVGACTGFGAICGSGPATTATMTLVALPEMKRYRYDMELASGSVAAGGTLGMMIPPSVVFIVYAILTEQSIGQLFISGIIPGLLIAFLFCVMIYINCIRHPHLGPAGPKTTLVEKFASLHGLLETIILFVLVMGGMFAGFFTATEAAAIGAGGSLIVAFVKRQLSFKTLVRAILETVRTSCMVMIIVAGATVFGHFLAVTQIPLELATWLSGLPLPSWVVMSFIIVFYVIAGCFADALAVVILTVPIFYPVIINLHYDPIWFGVMIVLLTQIGVISPPVGVCSYVVSGIERDIPLQTVFKGIMPFLYMLVIAAIIMMIFPSLATWLPEVMRK